MRHKPFMAISYARFVILPVIGGGIPRPMTTHQRKRKVRQTSSHSLEHRGKQLI
jgi:hypothetical protein